MGKWKYSCIMNFCLHAVSWLQLCFPTYLATCLLFYTPFILEEKYSFLAEQNFQFKQLRMRKSAQKWRLKLNHFTLTVLQNTTHFLPTSSITIRFAHGIGGNIQKVSLWCGTDKDRVSDLWFLVQAWPKQGLRLWSWVCFRKGIFRSMICLKKACKSIVFYKTGVISLCWMLNKEDLLHGCHVPKVCFSIHYLKNLPEAHKIKLSYPNLNLFQLNKNERFRKFKLHSFWI